MNTIKIEKLKKQYNKKQILKGINLEVESGIIFGLLGKNGAGKSTLMNIITGLAHKTLGEYYFNIQGNKNVRRNIGVLPDYSSFYENMTGIEHLLYFNKILRSNKSRKELMNILEEVGLADGSNLKVKNYSFGMKKKLGVAQALINNPEVLFLDEPTSGVDANSILLIHNLIRKISKSGTTIFLTSHNLDEIEKLSDKIAIMDQGKIIKKGSIASIKEEFNQDTKVLFECFGLYDEIINELNEKFNSEFEDIVLDKDNLIIDISTKKIISEINEFLINKSIKVYTINIQEPTLEEIFINTGK